MKSLEVTWTHLESLLVFLIILKSNEFSWSHLVYSEISEFYWSFWFKFTWHDLESLGVTWSHLNSLEFKEIIWSHWNCVRLSQDLIECSILNSLEFTWSHLNYSEVSEFFWDFRSHWKYLDTWIIWILLNLLT